MHHRDTPTPRHAVRLGQQAYGMRCQIIRRAFGALPSCCQASHRQCSTPPRPAFRLWVLAGWQPQQAIRVPVANQQDETIHCKNFRITKYYSIKYNRNFFTVKIPLRIFFGAFPRIR